jgi:hypothetical protein
LFELGCLTLVVNTKLQQPSFNYQAPTTKLQQPSSNN